MKGDPSNYPSYNLDRLVIRLPSGMRDRIHSIARKNGRSGNAEVVARLQASLQSASPQTVPTASTIACGCDALLERIESTLQALVRGSATTAKPVRPAPTFVPAVDRMAYTVEQMCELLNMTRTRIYRAIADGSLKTFKAGRRRMVSAHALREFVSALEQN